LGRRFSSQFHQVTNGPDVVGDGGFGRSGKTQVVHHAVEDLLKFSVCAG
jgi:hypothetical protein